MATSFFNGAFFNGDFFFGSIPPVVVVVDRHDGQRKRKRYEARRAEQEELKKQIREGFYGPDPVEIPTVEETPLQTREKVYIADHEMASKLRQYEELMADDEEAIIILLLH